MYSFHRKGLHFNYPYILTSSLSTIYNNTRQLTVPPNDSTFRNRNIPKGKRHKLIYDLEKDKEETLNKIQRDRIGLLINKAYDKYNNNIRSYNFYSSFDKPKVECLPKVTINDVTDKIITNVDRLFPKKYRVISKPKVFRKQQSIIRENKYQEHLDYAKYRKIYCIKFIDTNPDDNYYYTRTTNNFIHKHKKIEKFNLNNNTNKDVLIKLNKLRKEEESKQNQRTIKHN